MLKKHLDKFANTLESIGKIRKEKNANNSNKKEIQTILNNLSHGKSR